MTNPIPEGHHTITPYLIVPDADAVLAFLERAFGAEVVMRHDDASGRVVHAEARIGDSMVMLGQATAEWTPTRTMLHLYVDDVDAWFRRATEAGAKVIREVETMDYGDRSGGVEDAWGTQWWIATHVEDVAPDEIERRAKEAAGASA